MSLVILVKMTTNFMNQEKGILGGTIEWMKHPFQTQGSALNWILFVGLLIIAVWFWNHILLMIQQEV